MVEHIERRCPTKADTRNSKKQEQTVIKIDLARQTKVFPVHLL